MKVWIAKTSIDKCWQIGRVRIRVFMRESNGLMGRLGGGWAWKLGILAGGKTLVFELFIMSIRISRGKL